jgi:serine/threonine protein kinase
MSIHADVPPEQSNETLAGFVPPLNAPVTVLTDIPPVVTPGAQCFGEYEVVGELGEGGMGRVYKARHRTLGQFVAVKVLTLNDPAGRERFRAEALTTAKLEHANIVRVIDVQTPPDGRPYLVMEFADGGSLDRELNSTPQNPYRAAEMLETIARAVHFAHEHQVIHRDLKPANVLRSRDGTLKLTDFGLAKQMDSVSGLTRTGALLGTPQYMAPEQADGRTHEFGPAVDIYALGAILYEMLTGRPPFRGVTVMETLEQVRRDEPAPPSRLVPRLPRDLSVICLKCLEKAPGRRYATAGDLADDLRRWLKGEPIVARAASRWEKLWRQIVRHPWESAAIAASVVLVFVLLAGSLYLHDKYTHDEAAQQLREQQDEAKNRFDAQERERQRQLNEQEEQKRKLLHEQLDRSRATFNTIRQRLMTGELKDTKGLTPLYRDLTEFYERLFADLQRDEKTDRRALAYEALEIGEMAQKVGLSDQAAWAFAEALKLFAELERTEPGLRAKRGEVLVKRARALFDRNELSAATGACDEAAALWAALPPTADRAAELHAAEIAHLRGEMFGRQYLLKDAVGAYSEAIQYRERLAEPYFAKTAKELAAGTEAERALAVKYLRELGRGHGYRGDVYLLQGHTSLADRDYQTSHRARQLVHDLLSAPGGDPIELERAKFQLGRSFTNLARFQARHRAYSTAKQCMDDALRLRLALVAGNPHSEEYAIDLLANRTEQLEFALLESLDEPERRARARPELVELSTVLIDVTGAARANRARTFRAREVTAEAHLARAEGRAEALTDANRAEVLGDLAAALQFLDGKLAASPKYAFQRAAALALTAELTAAPPSDARWARALAELKDALAGGYRDTHPADLFKRRCFKALATDEDFKALVAQYGK